MQCKRSIQGIRWRNFGKHCNNHREIIDDAVFEEKILGIENATAAMIEVGIEDKIIIQMLQKYWDLRLSEATSFVDRQHEIQNM